jgi:OPA family glycerol-3-phosphate transporter-like MFS transporter/OPA family sugar phosphate sensor protein UhpC-like MFS transporter
MRHFILYVKIKYGNAGDAGGFRYYKSSAGNFLTLHGVVYAFSKILSGFAADKLSSRHMLLVCALLFSSVCNLLFGLNSALIVLGSLWVLNGLFQGFGFSPIARLLVYWIPPKELATKMAIWQTSHSIGAASALIICGYVVSFGWRWCFFCPCDYSYDWSYFYVDYNSQHTKQCRPF